MSKASILPPATPTANDELGKSHECSPMLERYLSEEPTVPETLLAGEIDTEKDSSGGASQKQINTFDQQWSRNT
ncbi:hypothetical protein F4825DRAFT_448493 [Nemania diffusa]|nr:hypothetical protein F4825DRAFT_448493 [Nemania diffusa]